jgi:hypothetical protein
LGVRRSCLPLPSSYLGLPRGQGPMWTTNPKRLSRVYRRPPAGDHEALRRNLPQKALPSTPPSLGGPPRLLWKSTPTLPLTKQSGHSARLRLPGSLCQTGASPANLPTCSSVQTTPFIPKHRFGIFSTKVCSHVKNICESKQNW